MTYGDYLIEAIRTAPVADDVWYFAGVPLEHDPILTIWGWL
jgi:hypothetical protein